eukprot:scaffold17035_cov66-Attheya_sp.AAC.4
MAPACRLLHRSQYVVRHVGCRRTANASGWLGSFMIAKPPPPRKRKLMTGCCIPHEIAFRRKPIGSGG